MQRVKIQRLVCADGLPPGRFYYFSAALKEHLAKKRQRDEAKHSGAILLWLRLTVSIWLAERAERRLRLRRAAEQDAGL